MDQDQEEQLALKLKQLELMFAQMLLKSKLEELQQRISQSSYKSIQLIELKCCCPKSCACKKQAVLRTWKHKDCPNNVYLTDYGNVFCKDCENEFFIKYAHFDCKNGIVEESEEVQHEVYYCMEISGESMKSISTKNNFQARIVIVVERYMIE